MENLSTWSSLHSLEYSYVDVWMPRDKAQDCTGQPASLHGRGPIHNMWQWTRSGGREGYQKPAILTGVRRLFRSTDYFDFHFILSHQFLGSYLFLWRNNGSFQPSALPLFPTLSFSLLLFSSSSDSVHPRNADFRPQGLKLGWRGANNYERENRTEWGKIAKELGWREGKRRWEVQNSFISRGKEWH